MKSILVLFFAMHALGSTEKEVNSALDSWHQAASRADLNAYIDEGMSEGGVFLGTDATERWNRTAFRKYAEPHFSKKKGWTLQSTKRYVSLSKDGNTAWFDEDLQSKELGPCRGSGVLVKQSGKWKIAQYNLSYPIPNEKFDAVKKLIQQKN